MSDAVSTENLALPSWSYKVKKAAWIGLAIVGALAALLLIAPHFIDLGLFKRTYLPLVEDALNRRLDVGEVRLSLVPTPSIRLSHLKVFDAPAFADNTFFAAEQVRLRLRLWPLLKGRFEVTELELDKPVFNLLKQPDGTFNYSDIAKKPAAGARREARRKAEPAKTAEPAAVPILIPQNIGVNDGQVNILARGRAPLQIKGIDLSLREFSAGAPFPFKASFNYPGLKTVSLEGKLDYQEEKSLLELENNRLRIDDLSLPVEGGIQHPFTAPRVNLNLRGNGIDAGRVFQILAVFSLAPRDTDISGPMNLDLSVSGPANSLVTQARGRFKDVKVNGKRALKGTLNGEVFLRLPLGSAGPASRRLEGNGKLAARDGELTNVDLIKKIERVTGMISLSKDERRQATTFKTLEADFILGGGYAEFTRLYLINPQLEVNGNGTMTLEQPSLDLALTTALAPQASARAARARVATFFRDKQGRVVVPLKVSGPVENPSVNLNAEKLAETGLPQNAEKGLGAFFKRLFRSR